MAYVSQKQLGGVITFSDINASGNVGFATDLGQARSLIFHQTTASVIATLVAPSPTDDRLFTVVNRGNVALTVSGVVIEPGPAYGLYWNGTAYIATAVEGVGTVGNVGASSTVTLSGDGSSLAPLLAALKISTAVGQAITVNSDGIFAQLYPDVGAGLIIWVDSVAGSDTLGTGTQRLPYKTIAKALSTISGASGPITIKLIDGAYTEDVNLANLSSAGITLEGSGAYGAQAVTVNGVFSFGGLGQNVRLKDLNLGSSSVLLNFSSFNGNAVIDNCNVNSSNAVSTRFVGDCNGTVIFINSPIAGLIQATDWNSAYTGTVNLYVYDAINGPGLSLGRRNFNVVFADLYTAGPIAHTDGVFIGKSIGVMKPDTNNDGINSTAPAANGAALILDSVGFATSATAFSDLIKTGNCPYLFSNLVLDAANDTFTGTQVLGDHAFLIDADFANPVNYAPTAPTIDEHLKAIDVKLGQISGGLSSVTTSNTSTLNMSGAGTVASPLNGAVRVSAANGNVLEVNADGLFVPVVNTGLESVAHTNSNALSFTGSGTVSDPLSGGIFKSATSHNMLSVDDTGIYVGEVARTIEISFQIDYGWLAGQFLINYPVVNPFTLPAGLTGFAKTVAGSTTLTANISLYKNGTDAGSLIGTLAVANNVWTITFANPVSFAANDTLFAIVDAAQSFNSVAFTLIGNRPFVNA